MVCEIIIQKLITEGEVYADIFYKKTRLVLPFVARLCLLAQFFHSVYSSFNYFIFIFTGNDTVRYLFTSHSCIILLKLTVQLAGITLVLLQKKIRIACWLLLASNVHTAYIFLFEEVRINMFMRSIGVLGGLLFLLSESKGEANPVFTGVPTVENNKPNNYLKLSGRCLLILMFANFISLKPSLILILQDILGCALIVLVVLGYKTKLSVLVTIVYLNVINCLHFFWFVAEDTPQDTLVYIRYGFFQVLSVTGGLLMIVIYGPGGMSIDENKKRW